MNFPCFRSARFCSGGIARSICLIIGLTRATLVDLAESHSGTRLSVLQEKACDGAERLLQSRLASVPGNDESHQTVEALVRYLAQPEEQRLPIRSQPFALRALTKDDAERAEQLLWQDHVAEIRRTRTDEMDTRVLTDGELKMPFHYEIFGEKPKTGRSLFISMHGGGNAPKRVNDQQWENQKKLYQLTEGVYVAPRAPTDTWNLWHQDHIDRLFGRLIENLIVFEGVDPDRVYLMGYSAGGDGVYQLAPRMADRLAAAAMMAGHPNETSPLGLRNLPFTIHVGALDNGYNRNQVARDWGNQLDDLQKADADGYVHLVQLHEGKGHWMDRQDAAAIQWMAKFQRNAYPKRIAWKQDDVRHRRFYWLATSNDGMEERAEVVAERNGNVVDLRSTGVKRLTVRANDTLFNLDEPLTIQVAGERVFHAQIARTIAVLSETLHEYGDPHSVYSAEVSIDVPAKPE